MSNAARDEGEDRKLPLPRQVSGSSASSSRGGMTARPRPPSNTHSLLPPRSSAAPRGGAPRMVFRPLRPPIRKAVEIKPDPDGPSTSSSALASDGPANRTSRPPRPPKKERQPTEMIASGPFAHGSASGLGKSAGRSNQVGSGLSFMHSDSHKSELQVKADYTDPDRAARLEREEYSDQEDGIQIVDMEDVGNLDVLAPTSLPRMQAKGRRSKKATIKNEDAVRVKREIADIREDGVKVQVGDIELEAAEKDDNARTADALDLSASEDEEVMDNLIGDFVEDDEDNPENRLYLFQFPPLFPTFAHPKGKKRAVSFAENAEINGKEVKVKSEAGGDTKDGAKVETRDVNRPEGRIGRLDIFRDGTVQFRFNDIVMDVTGGSQASFLQQVMILDAEEKKATTLGELHRKFVVAPEIDSMLKDVDATYDSMDLTDSTDS